MPQLRRAHHDSAPAGQTPWWGQLAAFAALAVVGTVVYANSFQTPFVFDSDAFIVNNPAIRSVWPWVVSLGGDPPAAGRNRPVGFLTFALNFNWAQEKTENGLDVWGYHAVNLAIHVAAAWLLFDVLRRTFLCTRLANRYASHAAGLAFAIALIWLVHPLQTESVTYVYQRLESLMGLFYLATLWCFLRGLSSPQRGWWYAASVICCALGMGCKEVMVTAPLLVLWYDRVFAAESWKELFHERGKYYAALFGTWCLLAALMLANTGGYEAFGVLVVKNVSPLQYALSQPGVILHYLYLSFWPDQLCVDYGWPVAKDTSEIVPQALAVGVLLGATVWAAFRWPALGFLAGSFFLILAPTSSVAPLKDLAFEHRMYLPLAAVATLAVLAVYHAWRYLAPAPAGNQSDRSAERFVPASLLLGVVALLGWRTIARNEDYQSLRTIWEATAEAAPQNARAHGNLSKILADSGDFDRALVEVNRAIALEPEYAVAYNTRGNLRAGQKQIKEAIADYDRAIAIDPQYESPYFNRGKAYDKLDKFDRASDDYTQAIELDETDVAAYVNRGVDYARLNQLDLAIKDFTRAIKLAPNLPHAYASRALAFDAMGRPGMALMDVASATKLGITFDPEFVKKLQREVAEIRSRGGPGGKPRP